jgi:hypothetical protein
MTHFERLQVDGWRQYAEIDISIHPSLTIITGANGAGKSTLLSLFSRHFGFNRSFLSTPVQSKQGMISYRLGLFSWLKKRKPIPDQHLRNIGRIDYTNGQHTALALSDQQSLAYDVQMPMQQHVVGVHIDSHRPPNMHRHVAQINVTPMTYESMSANYTQELRQHYANGGVQQGTLWHLKAALINMAIFGYGNSAMPGNQSLIDVFEGFQNKLRDVLPAQIGFKRLVVRSPEIVLETRSGDFVIDAASGGVIKLIETTWQLYTFSLTNSSFVATMDEPENHLHPSMQRTFLANLIRAFPGVQFIVVTHSPFVVSSVKESNVIVLKYDDIDDLREDLFDGSETEHFLGQSSRVVSLTLDTVNKAGTASEILRDALGVPTTIPNWAEDRLQEIIAEHRATPLTEVSLEHMYDQLEREGLLAEYPKAVDQIVRGQ